MRDVTSHTRVQSTDVIFTDDILAYDVWYINIDTTTHSLMLLSDYADVDVFMTCAWCIGRARVHSVSVDF